MADSTVTQEMTVSQNEVESSKLIDKLHPCPDCMKGFRSKQQLAQHSLVHNGLRKYTCSHCDKAFKQLSHLQQHIRIHTGEKPYKCSLEGCDRAFAQLSNLQHHLRNHDDQVKKATTRSFECAICHRSYSNESSLKNHTLKMHIKMKPLEDLDGLTNDRKRKFQEELLYNSPTMVPLSAQIPVSEKLAVSSSSGPDPDTRDRLHQANSIGSDVQHSPQYSSNLMKSESEMPQRCQGNIMSPSSSNDNSHVYSSNLLKCAADLSNRGRENNISSNSVSETEFLTQHLSLISRPECASTPQFTDRNIQGLSPEQPRVRQIAEPRSIHSEPRRMVPPSLSNERSYIPQSFSHHSVSSTHSLSSPSILQKLSKSSSFTNLGQ